MKAFKYLLVAVAFSSMGLGAAPIKDTMWIYCDRDFSELIWMNFTLYDTCRSMSIKRMYPTDTGDSYSGNYINFDYQFSTDTMKITDPFDPGTVIYSDYRPGYAGYKIDWDGGVTGFPLAKYKYMVITHKGPLPGHKVTIRFGYNTVCGSPTTFQTIGSFSSSASWKTDVIRIPDEVINISESESTARNYYEMQVLINNTDPNGSQTSAPGNLKIDDVFLTNNGGVEEKEEKGGMCGSGTALAFIPVLIFKAFSVRKRKKESRGSKSA